MKPVIWRLRPNRIGSPFALNTSPRHTNSKWQFAFRVESRIVTTFQFISGERYRLYRVQSNCRILFWGWFRPNRPYWASRRLSYIKYFGTTYTARAATSRNSKTMQMRNDIDINALIRNHHNNNNNKSKRDDEDERQTNGKYNFDFHRNGKVTVCSERAVCRLSSKIVSGGKCFQWDNGCAHDFYLFNTLASASSCLCYTTTHTHTNTPASRHVQSLCLDGNEMYVMNQSRMHDGTRATSSSNVRDKDAQRWGERMLPQQQKHKFCTARLTSFDGFCVFVCVCVGFYFSSIYAPHARAFIPQLHEQRPTNRQCIAIERHTTSNEHVQYRFHVHPTQTRDREHEVEEKHEWGEWTVCKRE